MVRPALVLLAFALLAGACASSRAGEPLPPATATPSPSATPTPLPSPTALPAIPDAAPAQSSNEPTQPAPTPTLFSEVLPESRSPTPPPPVAVTPVRGGTTLPLPDGTTVLWGGCASDGECNWFNFYWAPTREVVMQNGESQVKVQHELCHAHQHWSINGGAPLDPSDYNLESWYSAAEGESFLAAIDGLAWPWSHSAVNGLEDFAWTCADWYLQPAHLLQVSPERYAWAADNLP